MNKYPQGSEWRKWDLHVHAPGGHLNDGYKTTDDSDVLEKFCNEIESSDVRVFGITDYFSVDGYNSFIERFDTIYPNSEKTFFFNLELRLNETVNQELEEVNIHLIFNPNSLDKIDKFLSSLNVVKTGRDETPIACKELEDGDYASATVTRKSITDAFEATYGRKAIRQDHLLILTAANNDGLRPERGKQRKEGICDEIDKFSDGFFGGSQNVDYYLDEERLEDDDFKIAKKPVVSGSDSHTFEDLEKFLGKQYLEKTEKDGTHIEYIVKDVTWLKADTTYEGLRQMLYEPESGERVFIGVVKPDQKDAYKVIRKIKFTNSEDFPEEIILNDNLCSIIGSRSSGKSALLAYMAHSIIPDVVEDLIDGPGEGEEFHWDKIEEEYFVEWADGNSNEESPGRVVYVPQNYLFERSKDPEAIKEKIEPVLFKTIEGFENFYGNALSEVKEYNDEILNKVDEWFASSDSINAIDNQLKSLGNKKTVEQQTKETEKLIEKLKEENKLSADDLENYREITSQISSLEERKKQISTELSIVSKVEKDKNYFSNVEISFTPSITTLSASLQKIIMAKFQSAKKSILDDANEGVFEYKDSLLKEQQESQDKLDKIKEDNKDLIEKYQKNTELEDLVKTVNGYVSTIEKINGLEESKKTKQLDKNSCVETIKTSLIKRHAVIESIRTYVDESKQDSVSGIKFGIEFGLEKSDIDDFSGGINLKEKTTFVEKNQLNFDSIRSNPGDFLSDIYSGTQKVNMHVNKKEICEGALTLTEKILFTAAMEGDRIGGFTESTMTPGKRALFALRLILAESDDTWPLLIDQPEDDLDSRSIYDEVVPFLKEKKKERQIIMVSHNANLVISSDSEQLIIANRNGDDRPNENGSQFNYLTGSLEFTQQHDSDCEDTLSSQGVCEHACSILDGGKTAFENRKNKYNIK